MSSPPLRSAPLAEGLVWLAAEARAEKEEAGRIAALFIEVFARLLTRLAAVAARLEAGAPPPPALSLAPTRDITSPAPAPVAPALLPRVFGWFGGLLPVGDSIAPRFEDRTRVSPAFAVGTGLGDRQAATGDMRVDGPARQVPRTPSPAPPATKVFRAQVGVPPSVPPVLASVRATVHGAATAARRDREPIFQNANSHLRVSTCISLRYHNDLRRERRSHLRPGPRGTT